MIHQNIELHNTVEIHPGDDGHTEMGLNLARGMSNILDLRN